MENDQNELIPGPSLYNEDGAHRAPTEEILFYRAVARGDIDYVQANCDANVFADLSGTGTLSNDPVTNMKYHFIVTAALTCRFCMEGGMAMEESFHLSDHYIQQMDRCTKIEEVILAHDRMVMDYTVRMHSLRINAASSKQVAEAIDYIYVHIRERLTVDDIAKAVNISPTYLSRIFKQEIGVSISEYIRRRKIDMAKNLLRFTDYSLVDIANMLSYSSQSHFIQQFRSSTGMTPKVYRDNNFMNNFNVNREKEGYKDTFSGEDPNLL